MASDASNVPPLVRSDHVPDVEPVNTSAQRSLFASAEIKRMVFCVG